MDKRTTLSTKIDEYKLMLSQGKGNLSLSNSGITNLELFFTVDDIIYYEPKNIAAMMSNVFLDDKELKTWIRDQYNKVIPYYKEFKKRPPKTPEEYIEHMFDYYNVKVTIDRQLSGKINSHGFVDTIDSSDLLVKIKFNNAKYKLGFKPGDIDLFVEHTKIDMSSNIIGTFRQKYYYQPQDQKVVEDMWDRIYRAHFKNNDLDKDFIVATLKSFMWQVKRKTFNKPIKLIRMLTLFGAQKFGKSHFIQEGLCGVYKDIVFECSQVNELIDGKLIDAYQAPIIYFDEMASADKAEIAKIKQIITGDTVGIRIFHSQSSVNKTQRSIFIASTNRDLGSLIRDETGMRRFTQLTKTHLDIELADTVNWEILWLDIDENDDMDPLEPFDEKLEDMQESLRDITLVEEFLRSEKITIHSNKELNKISSSIYEQYVEYANTSKKAVKTARQFGMEVTNLIKMRLYDMYKIEELPRKQGNCLIKIQVDNLIDMTPTLTKSNMSVVNKGSQADKIQAILKRRG